MSILRKEQERENELKRFVAQHGYNPKRRILNILVGGGIVVYSILPLFSLWALPIGLFVMFSPVGIVKALRICLKDIRFFVEKKMILWGLK